MCFLFFFFFFAAPGFSGASCRFLFLCFVVVQVSWGTFLLSWKAENRLFPSLIRKKNLGLRGLLSFVVRVA